MIRPASTAIALVALMLTGCQTAREAYYDASEEYLGYAKRERLVNRVVAARDEQAEAKEQFQTALEQFKSVVNYEGGDLEAMYNKLKKEYDRSADAAEGVDGRINDVKKVATALFGEWDADINQMTDAELKASNAKLRDETKASYDELIARMEGAAGTMQPVLAKFNDRVLFIKGNLNARAIGSLRGTEIQLGADIDNLIKEMEASIAEADAFIAEMKPAG